MATVGALRMNFSDDLGRKLINFQDINQLHGILVTILAR